MPILCQMLIDCQTKEIKISNSLDYMFIQIQFYDYILNVSLFMVKKCKFCKWQFVYF